MSNHLKELVAEIEESPKQNTHLDASTDEQAIEAWEKEINQVESNQ